jgi:hypothetical protein
MARQAPPGQRHRTGRDEPRATGFLAGEPHRGAGGVAQQRQRHRGLGRGSAQPGGDASGPDGKAAPPQALAQPLARMVQPRRHRARRTTQGLGRLFVGLAFEVTQHQRGAVFLGQAMQLLLQGHD